MTKTSVNAAELDRMFRNAADSDTCPDDWTPVGAWIRVSSGKQDEANQVPSVIGYCVQHRYWVTRWYLVHAKSAFKGEQQEALDEAVGDMRDGNTKILVIWHSDRLERRHNREDGKSKTLPDTLAEFVDAGGRVESTLEPSLGKLDMGGQITTYVTSLMNNEKSKRISEDVKNSHDRIRANGAFGPGGLPWGYEVTGDKYNKTIRPTDVCKKYAPQIFDHCIDGDSRRTIAAWLDSENVKPKRGKKWSEGSVGHILANMTYAGRRQDLNGKTIMTCDAVIDMETFNRAKEALKSRPKRGPVKLDNRPMLASLKCARCDDSPMFRIRLKSRSGKYYFYYRCTGRGPQRKGCGNMVPFEATEYIVAVRVGMKSIKPYRPKTWIKGVNWESEMLDIEQSIRELNPRSKEDRKRRDELETLLDDYASRETVPGQWKHKDVLNADGSVQTVGEYFYGLDADGRREYLKTRDIRVEKVYADFGVGSARQPMLRIVLDGEDIGTTAITHELTETLASEIAATPPER